jgi:ribosomal protein S18 acetylase RimI-like enzyme
LTPGSSVWRKAARHPLGAAGCAALKAVDALLRRQERYCVGACYRYLNRTPQDRVWYAEDALVIHTRRILFPVFGRLPAPPLPRPLEKQIKREGLYAAQGHADALAALEKPLAALGCHPSETIDYELMQFDYGGPRDFPPAPSGPEGLVLRGVNQADADALFRLQAGYEQEEVLPSGAEWVPAACRQTVEALIADGQVLAAEMDGELVGKINVNAESFTRLQIGGVYVEKARRGRGVALAMTAAFIRRLEDRGRGLTLFVRKNNAPALSVYLHCGFTPLAPYRIVYY